MAIDIVSEQWRACLLRFEASVQDAIQCLDLSGLQIALVTDASGRLLGTATDGDIRRGLLRGIKLADPVTTIMHTDPLIVPPTLDRSMVLQLMQANKIHQLPVVDDGRRVVGLHVWNELQSSSGIRPNLMVVMAGGRGVRLHPHTENCPKPLLLIGDKPMLEHIIVRASREGFYHFVIAVHYLGHMIEEYFSDGSHWNVRIDYVRELEPLGTGGALSLLSPRPEHPFLVTNGDVLTDVRYSEVLDFHERHAATATMAVRSHEWQHPFGVVKTQGVDIIGFEEKPVYRSHVNAGVYVIEPRALDALQPNERCDMPTLFRAAPKFFTTCNSLSYA
jgi:GTP:adenosylcobinamide-phosphate guanylyltransferase